MALKHTSKVDSSFSMSSMSDVVFLLLIFFMITSTMVSPNALKLMLPQSNSQVKAKAVTSVSIRRGDPYFYLDGSTRPLTEHELEIALRQTMIANDDPTISLHADKYCTLEEVVRVMNIAKNNKWKLILATSPEDKK